MYVSYNGKCFVEQIQKTLQITVKKLPEVTLLKTKKIYNRQPNFSSQPYVHPCNITSTWKRSKIIHAFACFLF